MESINFKEPEKKMQELSLQDGLSLSSRPLFIKTSGISYSTQNSCRKKYCKLIFYHNQ